MSRIKNRRSRVTLAPVKNFSHFYRVNIPALRTASGLFISFAFCLLIYAFIMTFAETAPARGVIISATGDAEIRARTAGTIASIPVKVGDYVRENQVLFTLSQDYGGSNGSVIAFETSRYLDEKQQAASRIRALQDSVARLKSNLISQQQLMEQQIAATGIKISKTRQLVRNLRTTLDAWQKIRQQGYVSEAEVLQHTNELLNAELSLQLEESARMQLESNKKSVSDNLLYQINDTENQSLSLASRISEIDRTLAVRGSKNLSMLAPAAGYVIAINFPPGHAVGQDNEVVMVIRKNLHSPLEGFVYIPSASAGRIKNGDPVKVRFDAWPVDKYGTLTTHLKNFYPVSISEHSALIPLPQGQTWYLARIDLPASFLDPTKKERLLMGGMTLSADIVVDQKPLISLLLSPLDRVLRRFM